MQNISKIEEGWGQLALSGGVPTGREFLVFDTSISIADGAVLQALDASGCRHLLVPVSANFPRAHDRRSGGVHLTSRPLEDELGQKHYLDLGCQKIHLNAVFSHLADEVLELLRENPGQPLQACREPLQRWRELLDREISNVLSTEALCGLYGELWHLVRITVRNAQDLSVWQGPNGARHDFTTETCALEVKSTMRRDEWKFRIHGLAQLEQPRNAKLYLCAMHLELNGASGTTVPDLIHTILENGIDRRDLLIRLSEVGYDSRDEAHYRQFRFDVLDSRIYEVVASFPRLIGTSFDPPDAPTGVSDIHYTIDISTCPLISPQKELLDHVHAVLSGVHDAGAAEPAI